MKDLDSEGIVLLIAGIVMSIALFLGFQKVISRAFSRPPEVESPVIVRDRSDQRRRMKQIKDDQQRLMENQKRKIRDLKK